MSKQKEPLFSYDEICNILCEGCKLGATEIWVFDELPYHVVNDVRVPCEAGDWRQNKEVHRRIKEAAKEDT